MTWMLEFAGLQPANFGDWQLSPWYEPNAGEWRTDNYDDLLYGLRSAYHLVPDLPEDLRGRVYNESTVDGWLLDEDPDSPDEPTMPVAWRIRRMDLD